ncbi:hypothetical protein C8R44DRAFT_818741 [Mycena epipterygia]|nr:hypothetical protein C8R44DRAFT_818741 [Mycena epipterygia]
MAAPLRQRVIDDTDPTIQYGANGWFVANPSTLNVGNFGPIYNGTSHGTSTSNSSVSFSFNGTSIRVYGTIMVSTDSNNVTDPTWDCFVDEITISNPQPTFKFPENNWVLCDQPQIASGPHVLTIQVQSKGQAFYLDDLVYTPTADAGEGSSTLIYPNTDPAVSFGSGWTTFGGENATQTRGAEVALNFQGTSASLYGFVPTELPHNSTFASYTVDGGAPVNFTLHGLSSPQSATSYNVILFTTPTLPSGEHNLVVTHGGNSSQTPLVVGGFYVANNNILASNSSTSSTSPSSASHTASPTSSPSKSSSTGAIVGGVVGGLLLLALLAGLAFWHRTRRRRVTEDTSAQPFPMSMADGDAPSFAPPPSGNPYAYSPLSKSVYPIPPTEDFRSGARSENSRPSTDYPPIHGTAPLNVHPSDATSSRATHSHQLSTSTSYPSGSSHAPTGSMSAVASHGTVHNDLLTPQSTPPVSNSVPSKLAREMAAAAALAGPSRAGGSGVNPRAVVVRHEDSGVRIRSSSPGTDPDIVEFAPRV